MNLYNKYILPKFLNFVMKNNEMKKHRPDVVSHTFGITIEIGFGSGLNLPYYKNVTTLYALDPSLELYEFAKKQISQSNFPIKYLPFKAENIPLPDNFADSVISTWSMCSIVHPEIALKEIYRVLKPNGVFTFIEHGKSERSFIIKLQKLFTPLSKIFGGGCHLNREIDTLISNAGFKIIKLEKFEQKSKSLAFLYKGVARVEK